MPNWCNNNLIISGPKEDRDRFYRDNKDEADSEELSFIKSIPVQESSTRDDAYVAWGTDRDAIDSVATCGDAVLTYSFSTAWTPPLNWLEKVSEKYPGLSFELNYCELGERFAGQAFAEKGRLEDNDVEITKDYLAKDGFDDGFINDYFEGE